jgi:hypothetical protein
MTYLRLAIASLLILCSQLTFADSIKTYWVTSVTMQMAPNNGSGDNIFFTFTGPHIQFSGIGGMGCFEWCGADPIYDTPSVMPSQVYITGFGDVTIAGVVYPGYDLGFNGPGLFNDYGGVYPFVNASTGEGDSFFEFNLRLPQNGNWGASFTYIPPDGDMPGYYLFDGASFFARGTTPEPGTIALTLTGLAGIAGMVKRKHLRR